jgi:hypothetical protein
MVNIAHIFQKEQPEINYSKEESQKSLFLRKA